MKVAIVMPLAEQRGGGELMLLHLMQQGQEHGIDWMIVFLEDGPMVDQIRQLGVATYVIPSGRLRTPHKTLTCVVRLSALLRGERVDVLLGWMSKAQLYGGPAARLARIPALWYQVYVPSRRDWLDRAATLLPAAGVITLSREGFQAQRDLWPHRAVRLVYPGVELERFNPDQMVAPAAMRAKLGLPTQGPLVGIVGRMQRWKGMHTLVRAMPRVLKRYPEAHAVLVGGKHDLEPDYLPFLEDQIKQLGIANRVIMPGLQRNVPEWIQAMDVFVHASDREPFGIVIIEAMALGKPVIAGAEGGPLEIITDGSNGLLCPYDDDSCLSEAILRYLDNPEFARCMGESARLRAAEFSTSDYATKLIAAIKELAGRK